MHGVYDLLFKHMQEENLKHSIQTALGPFNMQM